MSKTSLKTLLKKLSEIFSANLVKLRALNSFLKTKKLMDKKKSQRISSVLCASRSQMQHQLPKKNCTTFNWSKAVLFRLTTMKSKRSENFRTKSLKTSQISANSDKTTLRSNGVRLLTKKMFFYVYPAFFNNYHHICGNKELLEDVLRCNLVDIPICNRIKPNVDSLKVVTKEPIQTIVEIKFALKVVVLASLWDRT